MEIPDENLAEMAEQLAAAIDTLNAAIDYCRASGAPEKLRERIWDTGMDIFNIRRKMVYVYSNNSPLRGMWPR